MKSGADSTRPCCQFDWGPAGAQRAAERGDIVVIVDVLSFSTAVVTALYYGGVVYPCTETENATEIALRVGGEVAVRRGEVPTKGRFSLSPLTYIGLQAGTCVVLRSLNGGTCVKLAKNSPHLLIGGLINTKAVAVAVSGLMEQTGINITVIACGEMEPGPSGYLEMRPAVEDYLGAGAILSYLSGSKTAEARVCEAAFLHSRENLQDILWGCQSSLDLRQSGFSDDVKYAAQLNSLNCAPVLRGECLVNMC